MRSPSLFSPVRFEYIVRLNKQDMKSKVVLFRHFKQQIK
jgi:hypothetical protein